MGLRFSTQSNRNVLNDPNVFKLRSLRLMDLVKFHPITSKRAQILKNKRKSGISGILGGGVLCSTTAVLLSWPWRRPAGLDPQVENTSSPNQKSDEGRLRVVLPPDDGERLFEKLGFSIFIFIAFCMLIEVFLMDEDGDGSSSSSSSAS